MKRQPVQSEEVPAFIGIDYHKAYSVCIPSVPLINPSANVQPGTLYRVGGLFAGLSPVIVR